MRYYPFLISLLFAFIFCPVVNVGSITLRLNLILLGVLAVFGIVRLVVKHRLTTGYVEIFSIFATLFGYMLVRLAVEGIKVMTGPKYVIIGAATFAGAITVVGLYRDHYGSSFSLALCRDLGIVGAAHAMLMLALLFIQPLRDLVYSFVVLTDGGEVFVRDLNRIPGLTAAGGSLLSVTQACLALISFSLVVYTAFSQNAKAYAGRLIGSALLCVASLVGTLLSGRTGVLIFVFGLVVITLGVSFIRRRMKPLSTAVSGFRVFMGIAVIVTLMLGLISIALQSSGENPLAAPFSRTMDIVIGEDRRLQLNFNTVNVIRHNMMFLPTDDLKVLFLGSNNFGREEVLEYIRSDVGYVRMVYGMGLVGVVLAASIFFVSGRRALRAAIRGSLVGFLVLFFIVVGFIFNFKELLFFDSNTWVQCFFLLYVCLLMDGELASRKERMARAVSARQDLERVRGGGRALESLS